ncbi:uncharacterized protein LOC142173560 [Nicotiana tabacum]|uniref:Uncharacterized protein LOC142173560 n=1 Tax=Nicotiana tabacum TaxID=4097 RepID=A0AC58TDH3_TOBAC
MEYATTQKGYLLYDLIYRVFFVSRDVQFREGIFPFKNKQGNNQSIFIHPNIEDNLFHTTDSITYPTSTGSHIHTTQQEVLTPPEFTQDLTQHTESIHSEILQQTTQHTSTIQSPIIQVSQAVPISLPDQPDIRKSCRGKKPPIWMKDFVSLNVHQDEPYAISKFLAYENLTYRYQAYLTAASNIIEPTFYSEPVKDPRWVDAIKTEIEALQNNHTWDIVSLPEGKIPIWCKWIYKIKYKTSGGVERFKARLVAK